MLINIVRLGEDSISVYDGLTVYYPQTDTETRMTGISEILEQFKGRKVYCAKEGVLAFIMKDGEVMNVTPFTGKKLKFLVEEEGYEGVEFPVPFSDGGVPKHFHNYWKALLDDAENPG